MYYREQYLKEFERKPEETHTNTRRTCKLTETHRNFLPQPWFEPKTTVLTTEPLCCPNWPNYSAWVVVEVGDPSDKAPKPDVIFQHWSQAGQQHFWPWDECSLLPVSHQEDCWLDFKCFLSVSVIFMQVLAGKLTRRRWAKNGCCRTSIGLVQWLGFSCSILLIRSTRFTRGVG